MRIVNKIDETEALPEGEVCISAKTGAGIDVLLEKIGRRVENALSMREEPSLTRVRHRQALEECAEALDSALKAPEIELTAEDLRMAMRSVGRITGQVQIEELLDIIFRDFCIGM